MLVVEETQSCKPESFYFIYYYDLDITIHFRFNVCMDLQKACIVGLLWVWMVYLICCVGDLSSVGWNLHPAFKQVLATLDH